MRTCDNYLEAERARREEAGETGFSLIELIIVVVILGVLVAIAIPIFANIQGTAEQNALEAAAANGATAAAAAIATDDAAGALAAARSAGGDGITVTLSPPAPTAIDQVCAVATGYGTRSADAGPGCPGGSGTLGDDDDG